MFISMASVFPENLTSIADPEPYKTECEAPPANICTRFAASVLLESSVSSADSELTSIHCEALPANIVQKFTVSVLLENPSPLLTLILL